MEWTSEAEAAIKKVPFFVRKKVRQRVESEATAAGKGRVGLADVKATQKRYLSRMSAEIKGYQLDTCFGPSGCPNRAIEAEALVEKLEQVLQAADLHAFLKSQVTEDLKFHHEFRVTVAECPNACSQPQIKDIGIIGAVRPVVTDEGCTRCRQCVDICPDRAVVLEDHDDRPRIDTTACMLCGKCVSACPTGTIAQDRRAYRVLLGGKLGRHPRLAVELPGLFDTDDVVKIVERCLVFYKANSRGGRRFADIFIPAGVDFFLGTASRKL